MIYRIEITEHARQMLKNVRDRRIRRLFASRIDGLVKEPEKQGRPLSGSLAGRRSIRAVGQRYRIIYRVDESGAIMVVAALGIRRQGDHCDKYVLAERLARLGLL
jgi:mRNA interferase RelE/StbE